MKFILQIILLIITVALVGWGCYNFKEEKVQVTKKALLSLIPFITLIIITFMLVVIPANNVGIKWTVTGGTQEKTLEEGIHFKLPMDDIYLIPTTVQERSLRKTKDRDNTLTIQTKDSQFARLEAVVKYEVTKENAYKVFTEHETLENLNNKIIKNYTSKEIERVSTKYNVIELLGDKKSDFVDEAEELLRERLAKDGITLIDLTIDDIDAGAEIEKAIQETATAKQKLETSENKKAVAETDAETKRIKAQGDADANAILTEKLTDEILMQQWIEKWDGHTPKVQGNESMIVDINKLLED